jgi:hypothetical protein
MHCAGKESRKKHLMTEHFDVTKTSDAKYIYLKIPRVDFDSIKISVWKSITWQASVGKHT